jgi:hypothetical protein
MNAWIEQFAERGSECFDKLLSMNGNISIISTSSRFALSLVEG